MDAATCNEICKAINQAQNIVIFTGAGISTESGIPDFRGPKGIWKTSKPIEFSAFIASEAVRQKAWQQKFADQYQLEGKQPNIGHEAVTTLVDMGNVAYVITQNVDGLHQKSGIHEENILEIHGNANYAHCLDCGQRYELDELKKAFLQDQKPPYCQHCDGIIKTATISFGQQMPQVKMQLAESASEACDLFIVLGSSLSVYPAANLPHIAKAHSAQLLIINNETTPLDTIFDWVVHEPIGITLNAITAALQ